MEEALIALLLADAPLAALLGERIHWNALPQAIVKPAVVMFVISATPNYTHSGQDGLVSRRVQIDVWGETYTSALAAARAVIARLSGFKGVQGGVSFGGIFLTSENHSSEKPANELLHRCSMDFDVWASA